MKCLKCEKSLETLPNCSNVDGGGDMDVTFHYGSKHDMCIGFGGYRALSDIRREQLLACDLIKAYICDECFDKHSELFEGFKITKPRPECEKVV